MNKLWSGYYVAGPLGVMAVPDMNSEFNEHGAVLYDFEERKQWAQQPPIMAALAKALPSLFRGVHGGVVSQAIIPDNDELQLHGVDRQLVMEDGTVLNLDEKVREKDFGDVVLEIWSSCEYDWNNKQVIEGRKVGWTVDDSKITDYIIFVTGWGNFRIIHFPTLREAAKANAERWLASYKNIPTANRSYDSLAVAVPYDDLFRSMDIVLEGEPDRPFEVREKGALADYGLEMDGLPVRKGRR